MTQQAPRRRKRLVTKRITVPGNFQRACDDYNAGRFFEAHEWLEEVWQQEQGPVRDLYKGLIQIAAGFVHISRQTEYGSERLLRTAVTYLAPYRPEGGMGWDIETIARDAEDALGRVRSLVPGRLGEFDLSRRPHFAFDASALATESLRWKAWGFDADGNALETEITVAE